jgi:hypothetical protein
LKRAIFRSLEDGLTYIEWLSTIAGPDAGKILLTTVGTLIVGIIAATLTTWLGIWRDTRAEERKLRRTEKYAAVLLCSALDLFINEALDGAIDYGVLDDKLHLTPGKPYPMLSYPKEVDWTCLDETLMSSALRLVGEVDSGRRAVQWEQDALATPPVKPSLFEERIIRVSEAGIKASRLLLDIKKRYKITTQDRADINLIRVFATYLTDTEQQRAERKKAEATHRVAEALAKGMDVPMPMNPATKRVVDALMLQRPQTDLSNDQA